MDSHFIKANIEAMPFFLTVPMCALKVYPRCCNLSLEVKSDEGKQLEYTHVIRQGPSKHRGDYGIALAHSMGFPSEVIEEATKMSAMLKKKTEKTFVMDVEASGTHKRRKQIDRLVDVS